MSNTDIAFSGSIPVLYETYMGPLIFRPYAEDIASRLSGLASGRILETAAGTGIVTRALDKTLPAGVKIIATDLNQPMLDHAASLLVSDRVTWQKADAQSLPFADGSFDAVVCQFGVMFLPDRIKAYQEARRVLKPGGTFLFNVWDKLENNELAETVTATVAQLFPDNPSYFLARTPHGYHDTVRILSELRSAGFTDIAFETVTRRSKAPSAREPAIGYCQGTPMRNEINSRDPNRLGEVTEAAATNIAARFGHGTVDGKIQAHVIAAKC